MSVLGFPLCMCVNSRLMYLALQTLLFERLYVVPGQFLWFPIVHDVSVVCACLLCICKGHVTRTCDWKERTTCCQRLSQHMQCGDKMNENATGGSGQVYWMLRLCYTPPGLSSSFGFLGCRFPPDTISNLVLYNSPTALSKKNHCFSKITFLWGNQTSDEHGTSWYFTV